MFTAEINHLANVFNFNLFSSPTEEPTTTQGKKRKFTEKDYEKV